MALHRDNLPFSVDREPLFEDEQGFRQTMFFSRSAVEIARENGPPWKYYNAQIVPAAVLNPAAVFKGLTRKNFDEAYCYSSKPKQRWNDDQQLEQMPGNFVFLVFVKWFQGFVVFDWEFRPEMPGKPGHPIDWAINFEECVYEHRSAGDGIGDA